jgi:hypothetical protein
MAHDDAAHASGTRKRSLRTPLKSHIRSKSLARLGRPEKMKGLGARVGCYRRVPRLTRLASNHLFWPMARDSRTFEVRVVEPSRYLPDFHASVFKRTVEHLLGQAPPELDGYTPRIPAAEPYDLLSFPEAFAPAPAFMEVLQAIAITGQPGCIHVGLRPDEGEEHLFKVPQLSRLLKEIAGVPRLAGQDLEPFAQWLALQRDDLSFNIGCLFGMDCDGSLRICLHPKAVRSKFEHSAVSDEHMEEADLLSLVTFVPRNQSRLTVTIQPLICSDALDLPKDHGVSPMLAVNRGDSELSNPPDHVDIVSIVMCTPQVRRRRLDGEGDYVDWHGDYRTTFCSAAKNAAYGRHHFATFILTNFATFGTKVAGLSGLFQPIDPRTGFFHEAVQLCRFGRKASQKSGDNDWYGPGEPADAVDQPDDWRWRAYSAGLKPLGESEDAAVRIFGFTLPNMLRDASPWTKPAGPSRCKVLAARQLPNRDLAFSDWNLS